MAKIKLSPDGKKFAKFLKNFTYTVDGWVSKKAPSELFISLQK